MRPKFEIYTPKRDHEHPHPFHMRSAPPPPPHRDPFALQLIMTHTPRDPGTDVRNILANSSHPTDPAEPATAAPTATPGWGGSAAIYGLYQSAYAINENNRFPERFNFELAFNLPLSKSIVNTGVTGRVTLFLTMRMSQFFAKLGLNSISWGLLTIVCPDICLIFLQIGA